MTPKNAVRVVTARKGVSTKFRGWCMATLCACAVASGLCSCDEELEPWVVASLELSQGDEQHLFYHNGGSFTLGIKANTDWTVTAPSWIELDKTSGTGDATLTCNVLENLTASNRSGTINVVACQQSPSTVAGISQKSWSVSQTSEMGSYVDAFANNTTISDLSYTKEVTYHGYMAPDHYYYVDHTITFTLASPLSDEELGQYVSRGAVFYAGFTAQQASFEVKNGTITVEFDKMEIGRVSRIVDLVFRFYDVNGELHDFANGDFDNVPITVIDLTD